METSLKIRITEDRIFVDFFIDNKGEKSSINISGNKTVELTELLDSAFPIFYKKFDNVLKS